jgi:hypothetical protein
MKSYTLSLIIFFQLIVSISAFAQHPPVFEGIQSDTTYVALDDFAMNLVRYKYRTPNINFLAIHDNEDTGVKAAFEYIRFSGGMIIDPQYGGRRNYVFNHNGTHIDIDPNSIYTEAGIRQKLDDAGIDDDEVVDELSKVSKVILNLYSPGKPEYIFTLHNNGDGGFGIPSYLEGYELEGTADSIHINFEMDPDDFILVTEIPLYNTLKKENVNVVLQSPEAPDDGSLSIYAMQNKIPYVNVEVQHGHQNEHLSLIEIAIKAFKENYPSLNPKKE